MARITDNTLSGGMLITNYDYSAFFLGNNTFISADYTNSDVYPVSLAMGTVMGRIASTGKVIPLDSTASDGSQFPIGVLATSYEVEDGADQEVRICTGGGINASLVGFYNGTDTLDTIVSSRRLRDSLASDTVGIILETPDELSELDNQ